MSRTIGMSWASIVRPSPKIIRRSVTFWTVPTKPLDYFKEAGSGRTPLLVACAAAGNPAGPCFRNIEALSFTPTRL